MKCLSFVGSGPLHETTYRWEGQCCRTPAVQEALSEFFPVDEVVLFTTEGAARTNYASVAGRLPGCRKVDIPDGKSEQELWEIFRIVCNEVRPEDEILFDITHGFRSLPFVSFLTMAYLKETKGVRIGKVVYGAYEARDDGGTPIFDLTGFISILDWFTAVRSFSGHVDATDLRDLLAGIQAQAHRERGNRTPPTRLINWSNRLQDFTAAVRLSRPIDALGAAESIFRDFDTVEEEIAGFVPALNPVMDRIRDLEQLAAKDPDPERGPDWGYAERQLRLIEYQVEKGLYLQAAELAREWMVTTLIIRFGDSRRDWLDRDVRLTVERTLSGGVLKRQGKWFEPTELTARFETLRGWEDMADTWERVTGLRNDLAHCGMNTGGTGVASLERRALSLSERLRAFFAANTPSTRDKE